MAEYIGGRIVPTHGGVWNKTREYEELTIVLNEATGDSYISKRPVPAGTEIYEEHYWVLYSQYNEQITRAEDHLDDTARAIRSEMNEQARTVNQRMDQAEENVDQRASAAEALSNQNKATLEQRMSVIEARQEANVRASTDASADYAAELVDARVDLNGKTKASLREAIASNNDIQSKQMALCTNGYRIDETYQYTKVAAPYKAGETITLTLDVFKADYSGGSVAVGVKSYLGTTIHDGYIMTFNSPTAKQYSKSHTFTQDVDGIIIVGLNIAAETTVEAFLARLPIDDPRLARYESEIEQHEALLHLHGEGLMFDGGKAFRKYPMPFKAGETVTFTLDVTEADYIGSVAVGVMGYTDEGTTGYVIAFDRPKVGKVTRSYTFQQDVDGLYIDGLNRASDAVVNSFCARLYMDDLRFSELSDAIEEEREEVDTELTQLTRKVRLYTEGFPITTVKEPRRFDNPYYAGDKLTVTFDVMRASYTGSVAVGIRAFKDNEMLPGYLMTFDSPKVKRYTKTRVLTENVDGIVVEGLNIGEGAELEDFFGRVYIDDDRFDTLAGDISDLEAENDSLDQKIQDVQGALFVEAVEKKYLYSPSGITDWVYNKFAACIKTVEEDGILSSLTYSMPKLEGDAYIEEIEMYIGTIDQRQTFLPRVELTDYTISRVEYTATQDLATFIFNDAPIIYKGETILCRVSIPHAVNDKNVWTPLTNREFEPQYAVMLFDTLKSVGVLQESNYFHYELTVKPLSDVYTTKAALKDLNQTVSTLSDTVAASATIKDVVTGATYKLVVANGIVQAKSMDFKNIFVIGHSFSRYPNAPDIGWFRDSDDHTALCPSIRDRDYLGYLERELGATITNPGIGWSFERNYAADYDFATMLTKLTTDHDCVIVFIGDNATYSETMTASWEALFAAIHEKAPLAEIFASAPWGVSDKYTAINQAILNTSYVNLVDLALIRTKLRNASDTWEGGEYYIGLNGDYYPLWQVVASHPNDLGHYNIANAFLKAMGKPVMDSIKTITLNQNQGGTISTPSTSWFEDAVVTIRIEAASGYQLASLSVVDGNGNTIQTTARSNSMRSDGKERYYHTFIMPETGVTVTPTWELTE